MNKKILLLILIICPIQAMQREPSLKEIPSLKFLAAQKVADKNISLNALPEELKSYTGWIKSNCIRCNYNGALYHAVLDDNVEIIPDLIAAGADMHAENVCCFTTFEIAENYNKNACYELLLKYQALEKAKRKYPLKPTSCLS